MKKPVEIREFHQFSMSEYSWQWTINNQPSTTSNVNILIVIWLSSIFEILQSALVFDRFF
jgi:hypothetical protein